MSERDESSWPRRRRGARRKILARDADGDLKTFLHEAVGDLITLAGASAAGILARFPESSRELAGYVPADGVSRWRWTPLPGDERYRPLEDRCAVLEKGPLPHPVLAALTPDGDTAVPVWRVPIRQRGREAVADLFLTGVTAEGVPGIEAFLELVDEVGVAFALAFLHQRHRRESLETRLLGEVGQEIARTLDLRELINTVLDLLRQIVPFDAAAIYLLGKDGLDPFHQSLRGYEAGTEAFVRLKLDQGIVGAVARSGRAEIISPVSEDPRYYSARRPTVSEMVVPLRSGGEVIGVFNLESDRPDAYSEHDRELLETFAGQAAVALERARLLEEERTKQRWDQELNIARRIQEFFLPSSPEELRRLGLAGMSRPSEEVGGDYFDFLEREDGRLALIVADVSGKGIPASLIMATVRAAFRLLAARIEDPGLLCTELNDYLRASLRDTEFVTAAVALFDPRTGTLRLCNAGHNPPLWLDADGGSRWLETGGLLLGAFPDQQYGTESLILAPGDRLVFYTDGVTEAFDEEQGEFGPEGLLAAVEPLRAETPEAICAGVVRAVDAFAGATVLDDLTLLVLSGTRP